MKFTDRYYKRRVYISCRHVIMVDSITVISWVRRDLDCDRGREMWKSQNVELECSVIAGERKEVEETLIQQRWSGWPMVETAVGGA